MRANRTKEVERSESIRQFLEFCISMDEKSAKFVQSGSLQGLDELGLIKKVFLITTVSRMARDVAADVPDIYRLRISDNLVALNIAKCGSGGELIDRMIKGVPPEEMLLKNGEGRSIAEMVARNGSDKSMITLIRNAEPASLRALTAHDGKNVCRLLWDRGSERVRIELTGIGASFGKLETFSDIRIIGGNTTEIPVDVQKACNKYWNEMCARLHKLSKVARLDGDIASARAFASIRKDMAAHRNSPTSDMILKAQSDIESAEQIDRTRALARRGRKG